MDELDRPDIGNIDHIGENVILLWQEIICHDGQPIKVDSDMDMDYDHHKSNSSGHLDSSMGILEPIMDKIEILEKIFNQSSIQPPWQKSKAIILYDIIYNRLPLNHLQRVVVEEVLNYAILNKVNQCHLRSDQLLLYVRREGGVGKNRIIKAIHLGFSFLKKRKKLLIIALIRAVIAKIGGATIYKALNIDDFIQKQQCLALIELFGPNFR